MDNEVHNDSQLINKHTTAGLKKKLNKSLKEQGELIEMLDLVNAAIIKLSVSGKMLYANDLFID